MISRGAEILCLLGGLWKIGEVKREDVKSGYRTKALITWARLARFKEISAPWLNATKSTLRLYDNRASQPDRLAGILVLWCRDLGIPSNHACRAARRMNQARNRTAVNTLFMRIASNRYIKMAAPGQPFSKEKTFSPWEGNFKLFNSLFHSVYEDKFCVVTHRAVDIRVAWLVYLVCLGSHVLPAYCNFESKQRTRLLYLGDAQIIINAVNTLCYPTLYYQYLVNIHELTMGTAVSEIFF